MHHTSTKLAHQTCTNSPSFTHRTSITYHTYILVCPSVSLHTASSSSFRTYQSELKVQMTCSVPFLIQVLRHTNSIVRAAMPAYVPYLHFAIHPLLIYACTHTHMPPQMHRILETQDSPHADSQPDKCIIHQACQSHSKGARGFLHLYLQVKALFR